MCLLVYQWPMSCIVGASKQKHLPQAADRIIIFTATVLQKTEHPFQDSEYGQALKGTATASW